MASNDEYKNLALNGINNIPTASVDSTGLLGMALAFRAASGELTMPDDTEEADAAKFKPWTKIDCDKPLTHQERSEKLEQKVKLLEQEIERIKGNANKRRELTAEALKQKEARETRILEDDQLARVNPFKKKTKPKPTPSTTSTPETQKKAIDNISAVTSPPDEDDQTDAGRSEAMSEDRENTVNHENTPQPSAAGSDVE